MEYIIISLVALLASGLTLFSGFGLGTILMPALALFFPLPVAVAAAAVVHLANNLFKLGLMGPQADWRVAWRFGLPGVAAAFVGAGLLVYLADLPVLASYDLWGREAQVSLVKLVIGVLILGFAGLELFPDLEGRLKLGEHSLAWGGALSGFFGGLSGNQGAFRAAFLLRAGLGKEAFVATGVVCAVMVDLSRLVVYGLDLLGGDTSLLAGSGAWSRVVAATLAAFLGAYLGKRLLQKVTMAFVQRLVGAMLMLIGLGLAFGVL